MHSVGKLPQQNAHRSSSADRILHAAKRLFAASGFENTTTMAIARAAQTSESQIIKHFGSKEGLLEAIFEDGWKHIQEAFGAIDYLSSPRAKLQALVGVVLAELDDDDALKRLFLFEGRRIRKEGHMVLMTKGFLELVKTIDALLGEMRDLEQLRSDLSLEGIRSALVGMMEGLLRDKMVAPQANFLAPFDSDDIRKLFLHVLQSFSSAPLEVIDGSKAQA